MAIALIAGVIGKLGEIVVDQVSNEASLLLSFKEDFKWLQTKLQYVSGFLQDAHDVKNESVKKWLSDVEDIAYDAEDIVEECDVQPLYHNFILGDSLLFRNKMGRRIRKLKDKMDSIMKDAADLHLAQQLSHFHQSLTFHDRAQEWKKSSLVEGDARPVAIDAKVEQILHLLEDDAFQVIAVVGMGGIGKTFLLQNVYNHPVVRQKFQKTICLSISQIYSVARLQSDIASHLNIHSVEAGNLTEPRAAELIHEGLRDKSSLIVLDDVWRVDGVNNLIQRLGIPSGTNNPCKVMVTTRSIEVCNIMGASEIYHMELLSKQDSWNLFCLHAFPDDQQNRPCQELEEVAHQVERECCKLPLAIKTVAASMAKEKLLRNWQSKLQQLREVSGAPDPIMPILRLSYDALPSELKPCFLYFSFFGEDQEIDAEYLIYLWIGEGFIRGKEQWSIGWSCLKQLNNLCLIEDASKVRLGEIQSTDLKKTFKIHDLLLDLIVSISAENNKCAFTVEKASAIECRRILLAKKGLKGADISRLECPWTLRTLSLSQNTINELPTKSLSCVRALRVIDLKDTLIHKLPSCIGNFKLLRVLTLNHSWKVRGDQDVPVSVPDCVRNLKNLCFLDARRYILPNWIGDLTCLQYLHVVSSHAICRGISKLVSLRTFRSEYPICLVLKDVAKLIHLQELAVEIENKKEQRSLEEGVLEQLVNMRHLHISNSISINYPSFPEKMKAMKDLEYIELDGFTVPRWICKYENLRVLKLTSCDLSQCPSLETMPNLMKIEFRQCLCKELPESFGKSGAFPQLRSLEIVDCFELEELPDMQPGAMPCMEWFLVRDCTKLQKIPVGFECLGNRKFLKRKC